MKIRTEVKAGIAVVIAIAVFVWLFNFFKGMNIFDSIDSYHVVYNRVNGLKESNPVLINGYRVGLVKKIQFVQDQPGRLLVTFALEEAFVVPSNTVAEIYSADLMGTQAIRLNLGDSETAAQSGDTLAGSVEGSLSEQVSAQMLPIKNKAERLLGSIDSVMAVLTYTFNEEFRENFNESFDNITGTLRHLKRSAYSIDTLLTNDEGQFATIINNLTAITLAIKENMDDMENILGNVSSISDSIAASNIASLTRNLNNTLIETTLFLSNINQGQGTIGMLATNDSLYRNLESLTQSLDLLIIDMKENPKKYVHLSLFGGGNSKNKEKKKSQNQ